MANPISLIKSDHRRVIELFDTYKSLQADEAKEEISSQIFKELAIHSKMEEKFFYPRMKELLGVTNPKIVEDALAEHHAAKVLLLELRIMNVSNPKFDSLMQVLEDSIVHHIDEEETTLLPFAHDVLSKKDSEHLGNKMKDYKEDANKSALEKLLG